MVYDGYLTKVTANGKEITYGIDPKGRRVTRSADGTIKERYLYSDQLNPIAILDSTGKAETIFVYASHSNVPDYMRKKMVDGSWERFYFVTDYKGSVVALLDDAGVTRQEYRYDSWGNMTDTLSGGSEDDLQPFRYNGAFWDIDAGLYHFGARDYDPKLGVWIQKEPDQTESILGLCDCQRQLVLGLKGALNFYSYCEGDPVNFWDLNGRKKWKWSKKSLDLLRDLDKNFSNKDQQRIQKLKKVIECIPDKIKIKEEVTPVDDAPSYNADNSTITYHPEGDAMVKVIGKNGAITVQLLKGGHIPEDTLYHELVHFVQHSYFKRKGCIQLFFWNNTKYSEIQAVSVAEHDFEYTYSKDHALFPGETIYWNGKTAKQVRDDFDDMLDELQKECKCPKNKDQICTN